MQHKLLNTLEAGRMALTPSTASGVLSGFVTQIGAPVGPILFLPKINSGNQSS